MSECLSSDLSYPACNGRATYYTVICGQSGCTVIFYISYNRHDFREKFSENKMCIFVMSEKIYHSKKIQSDVIKTAPRSSCIVTLIPVRFYSNLHFLDRFSKNHKISVS
jgi:hypothetical protein